MLHLHTPAWSVPLLTSCHQPNHIIMIRKHCRKRAQQNVVYLCCSNPSHLSGHVHCGHIHTVGLHAYRRYYIAGALLISSQGRPARHSHQQVQSHLPRRLRQQQAPSVRLLQRPLTWPMMQKRLSFPPVQQSEPGEAPSVSSKHIGNLFCGASSE